MAPPPPAPAARQVRGPAISLESMPVIELSQRPAVISGSNDNREGDEGRANGDANSTTANGERADGGGSIGSIRHSMMVPKAEDEPPLVCKLSGNSLSCYTELCGWSFLQPMKFFNIKSSTHLHSMIDGRGEVIRVAEDLKNRCISLREMEQLSGSYQVVSSPVFVQVIAKRKVDLTIVRGRILVIPLVIIADNSGYCTLCSMNEGLATIYNEVEVGDQLLITRCLPQSLRRAYHKGLFSDSMFLNLELKLQYHSVRNHYIWKFSPLRPAQFTMPIELFDSCCQVKLPSELETEFSLPPSTLPWITPPPTEQYYDLIGVVTYVGRIERFQNMEAQDMECVVNDEILHKRITRFLLYRWIHMVDRNSRPFPVKVYVSNATRAHQVALVPGAILVLSHCQTIACPYSGKHTNTSHFTQMYLEGNIEKYFMLHPPAFRNKTGELFNRQNYTQIMSNRPEIQLTAGGTHFAKICHPEKFVTFYYENRNRTWKDIPEEKPMIRRESRRFFIEGIILRVIHVTSEDKHDIHYTHQGSFTPEYTRKRSHYNVIENFYPFPRYANTSWYAFQRKLPSFDPFIFQQARCRDIVKRIVATYKPFCGPLLMPAEMPANNGTPPLATFEKVDGAPYLLIDIVNQEARIWYTVIWKSCQYTLEEKLEKVNAAIDKKIICFAEVYCVEPEAPLEVNLCDFVINN